MDKKLEARIARLERMFSRKNEDAYDEYSLAHELYMMLDRLSECRDNLKGLSKYNRAGIYDEEIVHGLVDAASLLAKVVTEVASLADMTNELELERE